MPKEFLLNLQFNQQGSFKGSSPKGASSQSKIVAACEMLWRLIESNPTHNRNDYGDFVRSVAKGYGVALNGDANVIFGQIQRPPWKHLGCGEYGAMLAAADAASGKLVVGAWKNPLPGKAGHVAIVFNARHPSTTAPYRWRGIAYWGTLGLEGSQGAQGSGATGKRKHQPIVVTRETDSASPMIFRSCCSPSFMVAGIHYASFEIDPGSPRLFF